MVNKRKKKSDNSGDEGDKSDASERRGRRTRWWSLRSRSGPGGGSEAELGEGRPRPRLRSPPPPQPEEHNTQQQQQQQQQHTQKEDSDDDEEDDPNIDPTTATNTISNTNIPTTAPPPPPTTTATTRSKSASQLPPSDIYSHSLIAPPRPRQTVNRKFWDIIHRRQSSKRTSRSAPPHTANDHEDPEYRSFDAAKAVRPSPRVVDYLPKPSERAAKFGTPPSILRESGGPRRFDFPLPAPTEAERNWRHTISRIPGAVAGAVLKERASVDFDKKSRVHGYFQSDPIYLTDNTTPERRPSPPPVEHSLSEYLDSLVHSDQAKAKSNKDDNNNKDNQNPQLNYSSLFDEFQGEKLPPAATEKPRRRRSVVFVEPEVPLNRNRRSLRPRPSSGPATAATAATTALAQIKAQQQQASSSSRGNPGSSSSSSGNKKSKPSKKGSKDKKDPKDGGDENKP
ncbi:hypothetical protein TWF970_006363 [Orbilia oligospora]|uniref:Uncharacterized protein n=1 Tax=Orbilia oligospora TaxID=2813651 RepID=A0A7C8R600_ORBOL|nr:hypothetical protein TWF970_006363 [Orbilia oligospora]